MTSSPTDAGIQGFWTWFAATAPTLAADFGNDALLEELDTRVSAFGIIWDLQGGPDNTYVLILSPFGDEDLLPLTRRMVALAPTLPKWTFLPARPRRDAFDTVTIANEAGDERTIDTKPWRYALYKFPDDTFDLVLEQPNLADASEDDRYTAAFLTLDNLLGEEARIERIRSVEVVATLPPDAATSASPLAELPKHIAVLAPRPP